MWQLETVAFLHWCLICIVLFVSHEEKKAVNYIKCFCIVIDWQEHTSLFCHSDVEKVYITFSLGANVTKLFTVVIYEFSL
jgi:hypothetical protein